MSASWKSLTLKATLVGVMVIQFGSIKADVEDGYLPNYANKMLSPVEGSSISPILMASRHHFPLRVVVLNNFYFNDPHFAAVKEACSEWANASKFLANGKPSLTCVESDDPTGADIVVQLCTGDQTGGFSGFTFEKADYAEVRISVFNQFNNLLSAKTLKRVALHELGHALGIWGHSPNRGDIMSVNEDTPAISAADINTLRLAYAKDQHSSAPLFAR